jgi:hypothetical protein
MALEHLKDPNTVSAPLRKAELEMAKNNPQGWASLAKDNLIALVDLYTPNTIPQEIMEAHYEKYKDVYRKYTSLGEPPQTTSA